MNQAQLHELLERSGFWRPFAELDTKPEPEPQAKPRQGATEQEQERRRYLQRDGDRCIRKFQREYKAGKRAFINKVRRPRNPYQAQSIGWELWFEGWDAGQQAKIERKKR